MLFECKRFPSHSLSFLCHFLMSILSLSSFFYSLSPFLFSSFFLLFPYRSSFYAFYSSILMVHLSFFLCLKLHWAPLPSWFSITAKRGAFIMVFQHWTPETLAKWALEKCKNENDRSNECSILLTNFSSVKRSTQVVHISFINVAQWNALKNPSAYVLVFLMELSLGHTCS